MNKQQLSTLFFFAVLFFLLYQAGRLLSPFFGPILCALATAIVVYPLHERLGRRFNRKSPALQALLSDFGVFLFLLVPAGLLCTSMISELQTALPTLERQGVAFIHTAKTLAPGNHLGFLPAGVVDRLRPYTEEVRDKVASFGEQSVGSAAHMATEAAKNVLGFAVDAIIFLIVLFFLFKDGKTLYRQWDELLPFSAPLRKRIHERIQITIEGVFRSSIVIGLVQAVFFLGGYLIIRFPAAVLFACLTGLASLLPGIGSGIIWIPTALLYLVMGSLWKAGVLLFFGILTAVVDGLIRPWIVGQKADMPLLWLMFAILGGLEVFGAKGLILGPLIFALLPVLLDIYRSYLLDPKPIA